MLFTCGVINWICRVFLLLEERRRQPDKRSNNVSNQFPSIFQLSRLTPSSYEQQSGISEEKFFVARDSTRRDGERAVTWSDGQAEWGGEEKSDVRR